MSIIRAIKHRLGLSVTPANNFVLDASADNGTMKLARESGQDIMTVDAAGKVAFPQMAQLLGQIGYVKLPGGAIIQWGTISSPGGANQAVVFPVPFPSILGGYAVVNGNANNSPLAAMTTYDPGPAGFNISAKDTTTGAVTATPWQAFWVAVGY